MVDLNTNRIIDMIETREYEPVCEWLKSYPNLQMVSRDGSITYKNAIEVAHPAAIQVSDRFHLLKNLTEYATDYLRKKLKAQVTLPLGETKVSCENSTALPRASENRKLTAAEKYAKIEGLCVLGYTKTHICKELNMDLRSYEKLIAMTPLERERLFKTNLDMSHEEKIKLKMQRVNEVRELKSAGFSNRAIAKRTKLDHRTVAKYIRADYNPVHASYGQKKPGLLIPYMQEIDSMLEAGMRGVDITRKIQAMGYRGSGETVRHYIADWKKRRKHLYIRNNESNIRIELIERKNVFKLLFQPLEKVACISVDIFERLCAEYPCFKNIYDIVWEFRCLLAAKETDGLTSWLKKAKALKICEINSFVEGVKRDFEAISNAVKFDYSNGLAEGKVNKLKLIKRIMYGRCQFATLRNKVLLIENPTFFN